MTVYLFINVSFNFHILYLYILWIGVHYNFALYALGVSFVCLLKQLSIVELH